MLPTGKALRHVAAWAGVLASLCFARVSLAADQPARVPESRSTDVVVLALAALDDPKAEHRKQATVRKPLAQLFNIVYILNFYSLQKIRKFSMTIIRFAEVGSWVYHFNSHHLHKSLCSFPVNLIASFFQFFCNPTTSIKRTFSIDPIHNPH